MAAGPFSGESLGGRVLTASEGLADPNFRHALVFLVEHNAQGALGLIVNRPLGQTLGDIVVKPDSVPGALLPVPVFQGGPVRPSHLLFGTFERFGSEEEAIRGHVDFSPEQIAERIGRRGVWVCAFLGYAGWDEGQLEREMGEGAWTVRAPHPVLFDVRYAPRLWEVFSSRDQRWRDLVDRLPPDPSRN